MDVRVDKASSTRWLPQRPNGRVIGAATAAGVFMLTAVASRFDWLRALPNGKGPPPSREKPHSFTGPAPEWGEGAEELQNVATRGLDIYARLRTTLEAEHPSKCIVINVDTAEFVVGDTFGETHRKFRERFGDAPSWD